MTNVEVTFGRAQALSATPVRINGEIVGFIFGGPEGYAGRIYGGGYTEEPVRRLSDAKSIVEAQIRRFPLSEEGIQGMQKGGEGILDPALRIVWKAK